MQTSISPPVVAEGEATAPERANIARRIEELGRWFHNLDLRGVSTAPDHFLGDFPQVKWKHISSVIPQNLAGASVLDIGCNGGFYSIEMKRRGANRVLGLDIDDRYLNQARFAAETLGLELEFTKLSVYDVDKVPGQFDYVFFLGVFYHLRYPLFALDKVVKMVKPEGRLVFQTMIRGSEEARRFEEDYHFWNKQVFEDRDFPRMYFVEHSYANDPTNWWIPNGSAVEGMLRSSGLELLARPEPETWLCAPRNVMRNGQYILDLELAGTL